MPCDTRCRTALLPKGTIRLRQHMLTAIRLKQVNHGTRPTGTVRFLTPSRVYVESQCDALQHPVRGVFLRDQVCFKHQAGAVGSPPRLHLIIQINCSTTQPDLLLKALTGSTKNFQAQCLHMQDALQNL